MRGNYDAIAFKVGVIRYLKLGVGMKFAPSLSFGVFFEPDHWNSLPKRFIGGG